MKVDNLNWSFNKAVFDSFRSNRFHNLHFFFITTVKSNTESIILVRQNYILKYIND